MMNGCQLLKNTREEIVVPSFPNNFLHGNLLSAGNSSSSFIDTVDLSLSAMVTCSYRLTNIVELFKKLLRSGQ